MTQLVNQQESDSNPTQSGWSWSAYVFQFYSGTFLRVRACLLEIFFLSREGSFAPAPIYPLGLPISSLGGLEQPRKCWSRCVSVQIRNKSPKKTNQISGSQVENHQLAQQSSCIHGTGTSGPLLEACLALHHGPKGFTCAEFGWKHGKTLFIWLLECCH